MCWFLLYSKVNQLYTHRSESESPSIVSNSLWPHGSLHAGRLEWVAFPFSRGSSQLRDWTQVSCIAGGFFTSWAPREAHVYTYLLFFGLPSHWGQQRALSRAIVWIYANPNLPIPPPQLPAPWYPYLCSLHMCFYFCFANKIIYIIFIDATYMH